MEICRSTLLSGGAASSDGEGRRNNGASSLYTAWGRTSCPAGRREAFAGEMAGKAHNHVGKAEEARVDCVCV